MKFLTLLFLLIVLPTSATIANPNLIIARAHDGYDTNYDIGVFVDSAYVTTLMPGKSVSLHVTEGTHKVLIIYGLQSLEQKVTVDEQIHLTFTFLPSPRLQTLHLD